MSNKPKADIVIGFCFIFAALLFLVPSIGLGILGPSSLPGPGAGFFPMVCSSFVIFFGLWIIMDAVKKGSVDLFGSDPEQLGNLKIMGFIILVFLLFVVVWLFVDFFLATAILCLLFNKAFGRSLKFNLIFTAVYVALLYGIFVYLLDIQFNI